MITQLGLVQTDSRLKGQIYVLSKILPFSGNVSDPRREILQKFYCVTHLITVPNVKMSYKYAPRSVACLVISLMKISYRYYSCA